MSISGHSGFAPLAEIGSADLEVRTCIDEFSDFLLKRGYAAGTTAHYATSIERFTRWLRRHGTAVVDLDDAAIAQAIHDFLHTHTWGSRSSKVNSRAALRQYRAMLRANRPCCTGTTGPVYRHASELAAFDRYLEEVRGLSPFTRSARLRHVGAFLDDGLRSACASQLCTVTPMDVAAFMERYTAGWAPGSIRTACGALRSYFAYRAVRGESTSALAAALPQVAHWRLARLPQGLSREEIARLLAAFDRASVTGRRDYAITRCLLDLGLRRAEVARLCLEDVDWRAGTVRIHGKGKRVDVLPLPAATARAISAYLQGGRPKTRRREIFVRHRPPLDAPADADIVRNAVRNAAARCGLTDRVRGTHILRHTLAEQLVQQGTRFKEIADLLRHRSIDTTAIYAKVDLPALALVALPWPGRSV